jgi:hypothetical protein
MAVFSSFFSSAANAVARAAVSNPIKIGNFILIGGMNARPCHAGSLKMTKLEIRMNKE